MFHKISLVETANSLQSTRRFIPSSPSCAVIGHPRRRFRFPEIPWGMHRDYTWDLTLSNKQYSYWKRKLKLPSCARTVGQGNGNTEETAGVLLPQQPKRAKLCTSFYCMQAMTYIQYSYSLLPTLRASLCRHNRSHRTASSTYRKGTRSYSRSPCFRTRFK